MRRTFDDVQRMINEMWDGPNGPPMLGADCGEKGGFQMLTHFASGCSVHFMLTRGDLSAPDAKFKERCLRPRLKLLKESING